MAPRLSPSTLLHRLDDTWPHYFLGARQQKRHINGFSGGECFLVGQKSVSRFQYTLKFM